jgi:hypothetical protein
MFYLCMYITHLSQTVNCFFRKAKLRQNYIESVQMHRCSIHAIAAFHGWVLCMYDRLLKLSLRDLIKIISRRTTFGSAATKKVVPPPMAATPGKEGGSGWFCAVSCTRSRKWQKFHFFHKFLTFNGWTSANGVINLRGHLHDVWNIEPEILHIFMLPEQHQN